MPRQPTIWFRESTGWFMTTYRGQQHKLGRTEKEARAAFHKLMATDNPPSGKCKLSVKKLCDTFLDRKQGEVGEKSWEVMRDMLQPFCDRFGDRKADSLKVHEVSDWLDGRSSWGKSTKALGVMYVKSVYNWSVEQGYLAGSPLKKLKRRKIARRDRVVTPEERRRILAACRPALRDLLFAVEQCGARPFSELCQLTAVLIDWQGGRAVLSKHKNAAKGKARVIYFPPALLARLKELAKRHPSGPLLRTACGNPWNSDYVRKQLKRACLRAGVSYAPLYCWRHSWITEALVKGVPVEVMAELAGNSPAIIYSNYAHVCQRQDALRDAAKKAVS